MTQKGDLWSLKGVIKKSEEILAAWQPEVVSVKLQQASPT
tara:strand:+ start:29 stop:148 length:120 start_codon:yes stop_codon:yes gene_type:complete